ncbi:MAG: hypothetical protein ACM31E_01805 [Fibrobacterota bacterium]
MALTRRLFWESAEKDAMAYLNGDVRIRLTDPDKNPVAKARCRNADAPDDTYTADDNGIVTISIKDNWQEKLLLQWGADGVGGNPFCWMGVFDLMLPDFTEEQAFKTCLTHLGFPGESLNEQVTAYQTYFNQAITGDISSIKDELTQWHFGGTCPGTVSETPGQSGNLDIWAEDLRTAFDSGLFGWGTDENGVYNVLCKAKDQMGALTAKYKAKFPDRPTLDQELYDEFSGDERKTALRLYYGCGTDAFYSPTVDNPEWVSQLKEAFDNGLFGGTDEDLLFSVLQSAAGKKQIGELSALYRQQYGCSLEDDLYDELSGDDLKKAMPIYYGGHSQSLTGGLFGISECKPQGTLVPASGEPRSIKVVVQDANGTAIVPANVEIRFGEVPLATGTVDVTGVCELSVPESTGVSLRVTNINESKLPEGNGSGTCLVETAHQLDQGVSCPMVAIVTVSVVLMELTFTLEQTQIDAHPRSATLELSDGSYASTIPLPLPEENSLEQQVVFKGIPTLNKRYSLFVEEAGLRETLFSNVDLKEIFNEIENAQYDVVEPFTDPEILLAYYDSINVASESSTAVA